MKLVFHADPEVRGWWTSFTDGRSFAYYSIKEILDRLKQLT